MPGYTYRLQCEIYSNYIPPELQDISNSVMKFTVNRSAFDMVQTVKLETVFPQSFLTRLVDPYYRGMLAIKRGDKTIYEIQTAPVSDQHFLQVTMSQQEETTVTTWYTTWVDRVALTTLRNLCGGMYEQYKLEDIIRDLFNQANAGMVLELDKLDNQRVYDQILVRKQPFHEAIRELEWRFGLYKSPLLVYATYNPIEGEEEFFTLRITSVKKRAEKGPKAFIHLIKPVDPQIKELEPPHYSIVELVHVRNETYEQRHFFWAEQLNYIVHPDEVLYTSGSLNIDDTLKRLGHVNETELFKRHPGQSELKVCLPRGEQAEYFYPNLLSLASNTLEIAVHITGPLKLEDFDVGHAYKVIAHQSEHKPLDGLYMCYRTVWHFERVGAGRFVPTVILYLSKPCYQNP